MPQESQNNKSGWRAALDRLEGLPGETPADLSRGWEQLHGRLQPTERKRRLVWLYYAAAACVLVALLIPFTQTGPGKTSPAGKEKAIVTATKKEVLPATDPVTQQLPQHQPAVQTHTPIARLPVPVIKARSVPATDKQLTSVIPHREAVMPQPVDTIAAPLVREVPVLAAALPAAKKSLPKFPIVHINELGAQSGWTGIRSGSDETVARTAFTNNTSDNIVKIRLSPSN